ncbi:hypothetical protein CN97_00140 [Haematobacter massiliensis]|uniref:Uncharacterized protein n=1 Tax=Haematobacter massiliensis TaxID=195105 RepID=A0A086Y0G2_9RHOB|nr:hypothetical protein [Haematobacter massiliensis]KFI27762.1 hypothetical protein CN97_00140 [Haematobacter massiliensis]OWJ82041.1 hypothetical protein CDV51_18450 [Haematobacter massiliensis]QBJ24017.1 hypothetical protein HmaOT1_06955 [Haematobacter massiliensis]
MRALAMAALATALVSVAHPSQSETLFSCGASAGYGFYPVGPFSPEAKWEKDGISKGEIQLVLINKEPDILIRDVIGMSSARAQGGHVVVIDATDAGYVSVLVTYPEGAKELYTFDSERRKVFWTQHKFGVAIDKVAAFVADCL